MHAAGGRFAVSTWRRSKGIDPGAGLVMPEDVAASWQQIAGEPNEM